MQNSFAWLSRISALLALFRHSPTLGRLALRLRRQGKTYLSFPKLLSLVNSFLSLRAKSLGDLHLVEFGVGRGGSAQILAWLVNKYGGDLTLFDLFGRIIPPTEADGDQAAQRYEEILHAEDQGTYYGNLPNLQEIIRGELAGICPLEKITIVPGKYEDTLSTYQPAHAYHLAHVDCDWYESTRTVLDFLENNLQPSAFIQFDDYGYWSGSRKAIDETPWLQGLERHSVNEALLVKLDDAHLSSSS